MRSKAKADKPAIVTSSTPQHLLFPPSTSQPLLLDDAAVAELLKVSVFWLQRDRIERRLIPYIRLGGLVRYRPADVARVIDEWCEQRDRAIKAGRPIAPLPAAMPLGAAKKNPPQGTRKPRPAKQSAEALDTLEGQAY